MICACSVVDRSGSQLYQEVGHSGSVMQLIYMSSPPQFSPYSRGSSWHSHRSRHSPEPRHPFYTEERRLHREPSKNKSRYRLDMPSRKDQNPPSQRQTSDFNRQVIYENLVVVEQYEREFVDQLREKINRMAPVKYVSIVERRGDRADIGIGFKFDSDAVDHLEDSRHLQVTLLSKNVLLIPKRSKAFGHYLDRIKQLRSGTSKRTRQTSRSRHQNSRRRSSSQDRSKRSRGYRDGDLDSRRNGDIERNRDRDRDRDRDGGRGREPRKYRSRSRQRSRDTHKGIYKDSYRDTFKDSYRDTNKDTYKDIYKDQDRVHTVSERINSRVGSVQRSRRSPFPDQNKERLTRRPQHLTTLRIFGIPTRYSKSDVVSAISTHQGGTFPVSEAIWQCIQKAQFLNVKMRHKDGEQFLRVSCDSSSQKFPVVLKCLDHTETIKSALAEHQVKISYPKSVHPVNILKSLYKYGHVIQLVVQNQENRTFYVTFSSVKQARRMVSLNTQWTGIRIQSVRDALMVYRPREVLGEHLETDPKSSV